MRTTYKIQVHVSNSPLNNTIFVLLCLYIVYLKSKHDKINNSFSTTRKHCSFAFKYLLCDHELRLVIISILRCTF